MRKYDTVIAGGTVVFPGRGTIRCDLGIRDGRIAAIADELDATAGEQVVDARGLHVFPGAVDAHMHFGIYRDLATDIRSESESSLVGGVTTALSYIRTGHHYLERSGPYREFLPEVLRQSDGNAHIDYGYHLAPILDSHRDEIALARRRGRHRLLQVLHVLQGPEPVRRLGRRPRLRDRATRTTSATSTR